MFLGGYEMDCALNELKGKKYSKKKLLIKHIIQLTFFAAMVVMFMLFK